ncbi:uncharacterized protein DUF3108 [Pseudacidovorax intermedius]|uniref:Uncharacterized protein DUF3108 n=2 Tax=Pseudacidovorax intermedius TaxID=433924 RepID=A0A370FLD7_9BURK|nr:DUF3108 domain-containing protein [Pseudacidovorax intermedius]RDI28496.1 uncharacterized protein DUF3108 [Pseudacidovorax intermedius]
MTPSPAPNDLSHARRTPWRALALLALAVIAVHGLLLGLLPLGSEPPPLPLAHSFSTREIVIAPLTPAAAPPAHARAAPHAAARPHVHRPAPVAVPRPDVEPAPPVPAPSAAPVEVATAPEPAASAPTPQAAASAPAEMASDDADNGGGSQRGGMLGSGGSGSAPSGPPSGTPTAGATVPLQLPGSVKLDFDATGQQGMQPMSGVFGELTWLQDGDRYNARLSLKVLFRTIRAQTSEGRIGPQGIAPERFSDRRRSEVATHFVRDTGEIVFSSANTRVPLQPGAQDRLSILMQLTALVGGDPARYTTGRTISLQVAGPRDADVWTFRVEGDETVATPSGEHAARRLVRLPRREYDQKIEVWLAPDLGWLPVRIRQTEANGDFADLQLRSADKAQ